jgi:hypothetical protein
MPPVREKLPVSAFRPVFTLFPFAPIKCKIFCRKSVNDGDVAQLGERRVRNAKVGSSILLVSTNQTPGAAHWL